MECNFSDLFFTCSLIEFIGRSRRLTRCDVVSNLGEKVIAHIYEHADTLHCEQIAKTADFFVEHCNLPEGDFDNVADCRYTVPDYWTIGKVYARLIADVTNGNNVARTLIEVYTSSIDALISNFNSDFFYQPRENIKLAYLNPETKIMV